jgi:hypothetical protein
MDEGILGFGLIFYILLIGFYLYCYWKIFEKAGRPGWAGIVPIYNIIIMLEIIGKPLWWLVLLIIPFVNFVVIIIMMIELAKAFGKTTGFGVGLALLGFIFIPILAFGDAQYVGAPAQQ